MKHISKLVTLLTLALALVLAACAEPSDAVKGIYDALLAESSDYSGTKALYAEYFPEMNFAETLNDDGFTIDVTGSEYMEGSWTFTREGDYLATVMSDGDFSGMMLTQYVAKAVGDYYGMNATLVSGYINGLSMLNIESDSFAIATDEATGTTSVKINIAAPWEMAELDQMVIDENALFYGPLDEDYNSMAASIGKVFMVANGNADDVTILLGEYGELDDTALQSIVNIVSILQPTGWEDFVANYTALADAEAAGYAVSLNVDEATVREIVDEFHEDYSYALIHFGA